MIPGPVMWAIVVSSPVGKQILPFPFRPGPRTPDAWQAPPGIPVKFSGEIQRDSSSAKIVTLFK